MKPIAKDLYFHRKVEYVNLVDEKRKIDEFKNIEKKTKAKPRKSIEDQLKEIMIEYDIKHPLRGEE